MIAIDNRLDYAMKGNVVAFRNHVLSSRLPDFDGLFDFKSLDNLYTTSAGDTQVVADGDPVGLITNQGIGGITTTSPVSAERPIYKVTAEGVPYLQFLSTSRVTFDFGAPFIGAMVVSTLAGSYIVEIDSDATFVWGAFMPVRNVTGVGFIEGFDIQSRNGEKSRKSLAAGTDGQLDWDVSRTSFFQAFYGNQLTTVPTGLFDNTPNANSFSNTFRQNELTAIPAGLFDSTPNVTSFSFTFSSNQLTSIPAGLFNTTPNVTSFSHTFHDNQLATVPTGLFDTQTVCTNYLNIFRFGGNLLTPQSVENVLVSINLSATNNNLLNGTLGIAGDGNPLTTNAEIARQSLLAKGWTVTLDDIQPYEYALFKMEI